MQHQPQQQQEARRTNPPGFQQPRPTLEKKPAIEDLLAQFIQTQTLVMQNQANTMKNLETQMGYLANSLAQSNRQQGSLPSQPEQNPRRDERELKAITLRSGTVIPDPPQPSSTTEKRSVNIASNDATSLVQTSSAVLEEELQQSSQKQIYPPPPFPERLQKHKKDQQFQKFLEVLKKLHINIPFAEALEKMPTYAKFMKELLSKKRRLEDFETVALTEECSAVLLKKLPPKLKDPGCFTIPCTIGTQFVGKALCDLGASINLMPLSIFNRLGLGEAKPTTVTLQLADRSITYPRGVIEDVLVKVDKLILPADFIVLDMEEDREIPLILGRPFLATGRTLIDVQKGELTMRVQDQTVTFNVFQAMKMPQIDDCFRVDLLEDYAARSLQQPTDPLQAALTNAEDSEDEETMQYIKQLDAIQKHTSKIENLEYDQIKIQKPSIEDPPELELKQLPNHLQYAFLGDSNTLPVIISSNLSDTQREKLFRILKEHKRHSGGS